MIEFGSLINIPTPITELNDNLFLQKKVRVFVKRDDLTHKYISGNKYRKLKYALIEARNKGYSKILTFGGAFSNHIAAVADACFLLGFEALGIIRGDELNAESSPTLSEAARKNMKFEFVSRSAYREKNSFLEIYASEYFIIPEGGTSVHCLDGVGEMVGEIIEENTDFSHICVAIGTGGTIAGILSNINFKGKVFGVPVLRGAEFLEKDISNLLNKRDYNTNYILNHEYHFGGYAKSTPELENFINNFESKHEVILEHVYTGKLFFAVFEMINNGDFPEGSNIIIIHTGGIQGKNKEA